MVAENKESLGNLRRGSPVYQNLWNASIYKAQLTSP
jgi:hypothetical protein